MSQPNPVKTEGVTPAAATSTTPSTTTPAAATPATPYAPAQWGQHRALVMLLAVLVLIINYK